MAKRSVLPPRGAILVFILSCLLSDFTSGRPLGTTHPKFDGMPSDSPQRLSSPYHSCLAEKGYMPVTRPLHFRSTKKTSFSTSQNFPGIYDDLLLKDKTTISADEYFSEPWILLPSGENIPYRIYESCIGCYEKRLPVTVITANGDIIPVSSFTEVLFVTQGRPEHKVRLSNGVILSASTYHALIRAYIDDTIRIGSVQGTVNSDYKNTAGTEVLEPTVILLTGEQLPYTDYESIVNSNENRTPLRVSTPKGEKVFRSLTELLLTTQNRPDGLVWLDNGAIVTPKMFREVINSHYKKDAVLLLPSGTTLPLTSKTLIPSHLFEKTDSVVILPNREETSQLVNDSVIHNKTNKEPKNVIRPSGEVITVTSPPEILEVNYEPNALVYFPKGDVTTAHTYRDAVIAHTEGGELLRHTSGRIEPLGASSNRPAHAQREEVQPHEPDDACKFVRINVPGRGVHFILGDGSWDSPRYCRIKAKRGKIRYEPTDPSRGLPCYESVVRPDGKVAFIEMFCATSHRRIPKVREAATSSRLDSVPPEEPELTLKDGETKPRPKQVDKSTPLLFSIEVPIKNQPAREARVEVEFKPSEITAIDSKSNWHPIAAPKKIQLTPAVDAEAQSEPGPVAIDGTGKLHTLNVTQPPCEYQPDETPVVELGKVDVMDSYGQMHAICVGNDYTTLDEPSDIKTFESLCDVTVGAQKISEVEVEAERDLIPIEVIGGKVNLCPTDIPTNVQLTPADYAKAQRKSGQVVVIDVTRKLHALDVPQPTSKYQTNETAIVESGKVFVIDSSGQLHAVEVENDAIIQDETSDIGTFESPCNVTVQAQITRETEIETEPEVIGGNINIRRTDIPTENKLTAADDVKSQRKSGQIVVIDGTGKLHTLEVTRPICEYQREPSKVVVIDSFGQLHAIDVGNGSITLDKPSDIVTFESLCNVTELAQTILKDEVEIIRESVPVEVVGGKTRPNEIPTENQLTPADCAKAQRKSGQVVVGKQNTLDVPQPTCEYETNESAVVQPGKVLVIDSYGQLHAIGVGNDSRTLDEPSEIGTLEFPCYDTVEAQITGDVAVAEEPESKPVEVINGDSNLCPADVLHELTKAQHKTGQVVVIDGSGKLHALDVPQRNCEYHPDKTPVVEPGKVIVTDSSGQLHAIDVGNDPITLDELSDIVTFESPCNVMVGAQITPHIDVAEEPKSKLLEVIGGNTNLRPTHIPTENQTTSADSTKAERKSGQVEVIVRTGKLHNLDISPPTWYQPSETPVDKTGKVVVMNSSGQLHAIDVGNYTFTLDEPKVIATIESPFDITVGGQITSKVEVDAARKLIPIEVGGNSTLWCTDIPSENQTNSADDAEAQRKSGLVKVIDGAGKLHTLDVQQPTCEYHHSETPVANPGKVIVTNSSGQLHAIDVGNDPITLDELSDVVTFDSPCNVMVGAQTTMYIDVAKEPESKPVDVIGGNIHLCPTDILTENQLTPADSAKAERKSGQVEVNDMMGKLPHLVVPQPTCEYQPRETPAVKPGKVVVMNSSGRLHAIDIGNDTTLDESSDTKTLESPCNVIVKAKITPHFEVAKKPESKPVQVTGGNSNLLSTDIPTENQTTSADDAKKQRKSGQVVVIDGTGKLHTLDIPQPTCEYQSDEIPVVNLEKFAVIESSGEMDGVGVGKDSSALDEPSGTEFFQSP